MLLVEGEIKNQGYSCVITESYLLTDLGALDGTFSSSKGHQGKTLTIDRDNGRTTGALAVKNYHGESQPAVLNRGSNAQYFKALTVHETGQPVVDVPLVQEFADSTEKPFLFNRNGLVITGTCGTLKPSGSLRPHRLSQAHKYQIETPEKVTVMCLRCTLALPTGGLPLVRTERSADFRFP